MAARLPGLAFALLTGVLPAAATEAPGLGRDLFDSGSSALVRVAQFAAIEEGESRTKSFADRVWKVAYSDRSAAAAGEPGSDLLLAVLVAAAGAAVVLLGVIARCRSTRRRLAEEIEALNAAIVTAAADRAACEQGRKALGTELETLRGKLPRLEKMSSLGRHLAGVAHEINNPISFVGANLDSLSDQVGKLLQVIDAYAGADALIAGRPELLAAVTAAKADAEFDVLRQDIYAVIDESLDGVLRIRSLVRELTSFSRADDKWAPASLEHAVDSALRIVWSELKHKAEVVKEYAGIPEAECLGAQLTQVFMNLLVNAAHAIEDRGTITIRSGADRDEVWIEIEDDGKGIAPEDVPRMFDPFFTTKPAGQGTGLGLYVARGIVERHRGRFDVDSLPGRGARLRVTLPQRRPAAGAAPA